MRNCSICGERTAIYTRRYSGESLCRRCFLKSVEDKVQKTISKYEMFNPDDRIAVAVSGGKDSLTLLHILAKIERRFPKAELVAITVDEGIGTHRVEAMKIVRENCEKLGVEHVTTSFKELYGYTLDEVVQNTAGSGLHPCSFCGVLRRRALNSAARMVEADKLATAHTLDDFAQTILINVMRNTLYRLVRISFSRTRSVPGFVPRVYPFMELYEKETALYTHLRELEHNDAPCPYAEFSMRWDLRMFLYEQEEKHPGLLYNILRFHQRLLKRVEKTDIRLNRCALCGYPTPHKICRAHYLKQYVDKIASRT